MLKCRRFQMRGNRIYGYQSSAPALKERELYSLQKANRCEKVSADRTRSHVRTRTYTCTQSISHTHAHALSRGALMRVLVAGMASAVASVPVLVGGVSGTFGAAFSLNTSTGALALSASSALFGASPAFMARRLA